jgi:hypothetical protein
MNSDPVTTTPHDRTAPQHEAPRSLEELVVAQGVGETATYERLLGSGVDLWADDTEFESFLKHLEATRRQKD